MDENDEHARLTAAKAVVNKRAAEVGANAETGYRVLRLLERDGDISLAALLQSFQADIDGYTGDNPDENFGVLRARVIIAKIRSAIGTDGSADPET
ncbi:MAG: hypothetical protein RLO01_12790 [Thalassobaculaceae bacterium]